MLGRKAERPRRHDGSPSRNRTRSKTFSMDPNLCHAAATRSPLCHNVETRRLRRPKIPRSGSPLEVSPVCAEAFGHDLAVLTQMCGDKLVSLDLDPDAKPSVDTSELTDAGIIGHFVMPTLFTRREVGEQLLGLLE